MRAAKRAEPALIRARRQWGSAALEGRRLIREQGAPVSEWIDKQASQRRGRAVVEGIARFSQELADAGVPLPQIVRLVSDATLGIVAASIEHDGPKAA